MKLTEIQIHNTTLVRKINIIMGAIVPLLKYNMIKVAMAIIITSMPNWPSVKYQGYLYPDMDTCLTSTEMYVEEFRAYADSQGDYDAHFNSICFEVDAYPIEDLTKYN